MIPENNLLKSNFADGMMFNPEQIRVNDEYFLQKSSLLSRYGVGKGILLGFKSNLRVSVENAQLVLHPGAAINQNGELLIVPQKQLLLKDLSLAQFKDQSTLYIYLKFKETLVDKRESKRDKDEKHFYKIDEGFSLELREKVLESSDLFELARVYIDHNVSSIIKSAHNPYSPATNEIDLRFASKLSSAQPLMNHSEKIMMANVFRRYADYLSELSMHRRLFTASIAASFANKVVGDILMYELSAVKLYELLGHLLYLSVKIQDELNVIVNTGFWKNILRLQSIFSFSEKYDVSYYDLLLNIDSSFYSKVLLHFGNAAIYDGDFNELNTKEDKGLRKEVRDYIKVGSAEDSDLIVQGEDIAAFHAKLYRHKEGFFIEDVSGTSGIYVNAERLEKGMKKFIRHQDFTVLGKHGKILNLSNV